ncbi:MAG TPA: hypothetical protein VMV38_02400 [Candidatus Paceibacterota bacterium]|nr:hypothetical protein [Candidatus Paceibacterota bacterium]
MMSKKQMVIVGVTTFALVLVGVFSYTSFVTTEYLSANAGAPERFIPLPALNIADYNARLLALAHVHVPISATSTATTTVPIATTTPRLWPVHTVYPRADALLPFRRIVAYYGNFYSKQMGVLGEYPTDQILTMLASTTAMWTAVDPTTPAIPAIQYIAVVAQGSAGKEGKYILRMPDTQIDLALSMAQKVHGLLILDVQVGMSTLAHELPFLEKYLMMPNVELAIDPEFSMKYGNPPGTVIGTFDASDVNYAAQYLAHLVDEYHLPPKVLIVHRFTQDMVTNYKNIHPLPEVEVVMDMDGWGSPAKKKGTYRRVIYPEPVQFTGIKLFYKADLKPPSTRLLTTEEVMDLMPTPSYIQYQ